MHPVTSYSSLQVMQKFSKIWSSICSYICLCRVTLWLITGQFSILVILEKKLNDIKHRRYVHTWLLPYTYCVFRKKCLIAQCDDEFWMFGWILYFHESILHSIAWIRSVAGGSVIVPYSKKLLPYIDTYIKCFRIKVSP